MSTLPRPLPETEWDLANLPMRCTRPWRSRDGVLFPCGVCPLCRRKRRSELAARVYFEAADYRPDQVACLTLTYRDEELVLCDGDEPAPTLVRDHATAFLKRLRRRLEYSERPSVRFFLCGEYGSARGRPHYHAILFGYPPCWRVEGSKALKDGRNDPACCEPCRELAECWGHGYVKSELVRSTAGLGRYLGGYLSKGLTDRTHTRLRGREPEFARWSRRPALGDGICERVAKTLLDIRDASGVAEWDWCPHSLGVGRKYVPLSRRARRIIRERMGLAPETPPEQYIPFQIRARDADRYCRNVLGTSSEAMANQLLEQMQARARSLGWDRQGG